MQNPRERADKTYDFSPDGFGHYIAVAHGCHGNHGPPKCGRNRGEVFVNPVFDEKYYRRKDDHRNEEKQYQERKLFHRRRNGLSSVHYQT